MKEKLLAILCVIALTAMSGCCSGFGEDEDEPEPPANTVTTPDPNVVATPPATPDPNAVQTPPATPPATPDPNAVPTQPVPTAMPTVPAGGNVLTPNVPVMGTFMPGLPVDADGKPYIDYILNIATPGNYTINLTSTNTMSYDPYIILLQNGMELGRDDDGAGALQSRLSSMLNPGSYVVRVTKFGSGQISMPVAFNITVGQY